MAAIVEEGEEEVAQPLLRRPLVEDNDVDFNIEVEENDDDGDVEGLDRSTEPTNDEFINFIVPDCLSSTERDKSCILDNHNSINIDNDGINQASSGSIKEDFNTKEDFFTPILPSEPEVNTVISTKLSPPPPSLSSTISKIFPTTFATPSTAAKKIPSHSKSSKNSKSCVFGTIKTAKISSFSKNLNDVFFGESSVAATSKKYILSTTLPTTSATTVISATTPTDTVPSATVTTSPTTLATKPSIEAFPAASTFSSSFLHAFITPGAYPILLTSTLSPFLSSIQPSQTTPTSSSTLSMGQSAIKIDDFPRTPLILTASGFVIIAIAVIVFWVFCCRQSPPIDLKHATTTSAIPIPNGYTPIPIDTFREPRNPSSQICPANGVIVPRPVQSMTMPIINGQNGHQNSYQNQHQQLQQQISVENDFFKKSPTTINNSNNNNNNNNGIILSSNGKHQHHQKIVDKRKSDYKEWYV